MTISLMVEPSPPLDAMDMQLRQNLTSWTFWRRGHRWNFFLVECVCECVCWVNHQSEI